MVCPELDFAQSLHKSGRAKKRAAVSRARAAGWPGWLVYKHCDVGLPAIQTMMYWEAERGTSRVAFCCRCLGTCSNGFDNSYLVIVS